MLADHEWGMKVLMSCATAECSAVLWASRSISGSADRSSVYAVQIICSSSYSSVNISSQPGRKKNLFLGSLAVAGVAELLIGNSLQGARSARSWVSCGQRAALMPSLARFCRAARDTEFGGDKCRFVCQ